MEPSAPVVVLGVPWWPPVVIVGAAEVAGAAEVGGRAAGTTWTAEVAGRAAGTAGATEFLGRWAARSVLRRRSARTTWAALRARTRVKAVRR